MSATLSHQYWLTATARSTATLAWTTFSRRAPYNVQVNSLPAQLPAVRASAQSTNSRVRRPPTWLSYDKLDCPAPSPRHRVSVQPNRLNVAISRARTLAVVLANPKLLGLDANSVEHLRLVNTLAWLVARAGEATCEKLSSRRGWLKATHQARSARS